jgi:hypothetical protein
MNQLQRAVAEIHLAVAPFSTRDRMLIVNMALEEAIEDDKKHQEELRRRL